MQKWLLFRNTCKVVDAELNMEWSQYFKESIETFRRCAKCTADFFQRTDYSVLFSICRWSLCNFNQNSKNMFSTSTKNQICSINQIDASCLFMIVHKKSGRHCWIWDLFECCWLNALFKIEFILCGWHVEENQCGGVKQPRFNIGINTIFFLYKREYVFFEQKLWKEKSM